MQKLTEVRNFITYDDHEQRLAITGDTGDSLAFVGFELIKKIYRIMQKSKKNIGVNLGNSSYSDKDLLKS